ncbi:MAG: family 10 glycosylhydrolase [Bacteroidales bacterium]|nr:family 10 glycosylhydrolase [Bacteroidales bacterium]
MNRRNFIKKAGILGLGISAFQYLGYACGLPGNQSGWKNWVWLTPRPGLSDDEWLMQLETMKTNGIDGLFVQIYSSHKAWFESDHLPLEEPLLERLIDLGKKAGIEVHAWMWTMPNNNPYFIENHPDWYAVNGLGQPSHSHPAYVGYYRFMCPNNPGVIDFVSANVRELASINGVSGVHLDYVRLPDVIIAEALQPVYNIVQDREYPEYDYCYCETCRSLFKEQSGIDPLKDLEDPSANLAWRQFRQDSITRLVNEHLVPEAHRKNVPITAAVFPNWEAVRQEWRKWKLDAYFPMLYHNFYNVDLEWIGQHLEKQIAELEVKQPVYSGLFIPSLDPAKLQHAMEISKKAGAAGVSLFAFNHLTEDHFKVIKEF